MSTIEKNKREKEVAILSRWFSSLNMDSDLSQIRNILSQNGNTAPLVLSAEDDIFTFSVGQKRLSFDAKVFLDRNGYFNERRLIFFIAYLSHYYKIINPEQAEWLRKKAVSLLKDMQPGEPLSWVDPPRQSVNMVAVTDVPSGQNQSEIAQDPTASDWFYGILFPLVLSGQFVLAVKLADYYTKIWQETNYDKVAFLILLAQSVPSLIYSLYHQIENWSTSSSKDKFTNFAYRYSAFSVFSSGMTLALVGGITKYRESRLLDVSSIAPTIFKMSYEQQEEVLKLAREAEVKKVLDIIKSYIPGAVMISVPVLLLWAAITSKRNSTSE